MSDGQIVDECTTKDLRNVVGAAQRTERLQAEEGLKCTCTSISRTLSKLTKRYVLTLYNYQRSKRGCRGLSEEFCGSLLLSITVDALQGDGRVGSLSHHPHASSGERLRRLPQLPVPQVHGRGACSPLVVRSAARYGSRC